MPATLGIDPLKLARKLTEAGMEPRMAEAIVEGPAEADTSELVTKIDLKAELAELKAELFRFMLLQSVGIIALTVTLMKLLP